MAINKKWVYVGSSPNGGDMYNKGTAHMIIYRSGHKRYWRVFPGPVTVERNSMEGREAWRDSLVEFNKLYKNQ
jgi:hypothetical protein